MRKTRAQKAKLAELLATGEMPVRHALEAAGWTPLQAKKGWSKVPKDVIAILPKKAQSLIERGKMNKRI